MSEYEEYDEYEEPSFEVIEHYFDIGKYTRVIELINEELPDHFENSRLWYMLGYSNYAINEFDEAEEQFHEAMRLGYDEDIIFYFLGHLYMQTERWQEAEEAFLEALRLNPNDAETHAAYAVLMKKTGHRKKAKLLINKALELDPENSYVLRMNFILEGVHGNKEQQILALEQYMNSADSEMAKLLHLGINASFRNNEKEAKEYYRQAFLLNPEDQTLLSILEEMEITAHPLLAPNRFIERLGGPSIIWLVGIGMTFLLLAIGVDNIAMVFLQCYVVLALYTWISVPLVKGLRKIRGHRYG
ncbi:tetratricopeptide repeat protein [Lysinibacillus sphaericus]|uniref:tetratricopeptide repeat protein n=1 Tax=Lysinibacillus sphaericus TaxID=1421 RepID=UPI001CBF6F40|nr:tetratricopeptide repeat protein [Lysinibacillus sphaericus]